MFGEGVSKGQVLAESSIVDTFDSEQTHNRSPIRGSSK